MKAGVKRRRGRPIGSKNAPKERKEITIYHIDDSHIEKVTELERIQGATPQSQGATPQSQGGTPQSTPGQTVFLVDDPVLVETPHHPHGSPGAMFPNCSRYHQQEEEEQRQAALSVEKCDGVESGKFSEDAVKHLISLFTPVYQAYNTAKTASQKNAIFQKVQEAMEMNNFYFDGITLRRKYNRVLHDYKKARDQRNATGRDYQHKYTEAFEEAFSRLDAGEIDVAVDDSANAEAPDITKRKRACGRNSRSDYDERKLQLLKEEVDAKKNFMAQMSANDNRKVELLQQLVGSVTSERAAVLAGLINLLK